MSVHKVVLSGLFYGQTWNNRFYVNNADGAMSRPDIANYFNANWIEQVRMRLPVDVTFNKIEVFDAGNGNLAPFTLTISKVGNMSADNQLVPFNCWVLQFRTLQAGRKGRGRCYLPGVLKGFHTNGLLNSSGIGAWGGTLNSLNASFSAGGSAALHFVIHSEHGEPQDFAVANIVLRSTMGTQRRRNIGTGT